MKNNIRLMGCGLLIIFSVSCQSNSTGIAIPSVTPESAPKWWTSWLAQPVCKPPCWQNITPGVTSVDAAVSLLEDMPKVTIIYNGKYGLSWNFGTKTEEGNISISKDGKVSSLWLANSSSESLYLKEIVAKYGFPKYVKPYDCREGMCATVLVYPDRGMLLDVFMKNSGTVSDPQIEIVPDTVVDRVYFIEPGMENFQKVLDFQDYDLLMDWKEYGKYP